MRSMSLCGANGGLAPTSQAGIPTEVRFALRGMVGQSVMSAVYLEDGAGFVLQDGWAVRSADVDLRTGGMEIAPAVHAADAPGHRVLSVTVEPGTLALRVTHGPTAGGPVTHARGSAPWTVQRPDGTTISASVNGELSVTYVDEPRFTSSDERARWESAPLGDVDLALMQLASEELISIWDISAVLENSGSTNVLADSLDVIGLLISRGIVEPGKRHFLSEPPLTSTHQVQTTPREDCTSTRAKLEFMRQTATLAAHGVTFDPWELDAVEAIERVGALWTAFDEHRVHPGQIAWFRLTVTGWRELLTARPECVDVPRSSVTPLPLSLVESGPRVSDFGVEPLSPRASSRL